MGTYAVIHIEYKKDNEWVYINPTQSDRKINNCYKQGIIRDVLSHNYCDISNHIDFPKDISNDLKEILDKEDLKYCWNKGYIYLNTLLDWVNNSLQKSKKDIEEYTTKNMLTKINKKVDLLIDYIKTGKKEYVKVLDSIKSLENDCEEDVYDIKSEYEETIDECEFLKEFCYNIAFLVEFLLDEYYIEKENFKNIRLVYYFC